MDLYGFERSFRGCFCGRERMVEFDGRELGFSNWKNLGLNLRFNVNFINGESLSKLF